jgi:hypothetical protein
MTTPRTSDPFSPAVSKYVIRFGALITGGLAVIFGAILLHPTNTFSTSPTFNVLAAHFSEHEWGLWMVVCGAVHIFAHWLPFSPVWRLPITGKWIYMGWVFILAAPTSTGGYSYLWIGLMSLTTAALDAARYWFERRRRARTQ